MSSLKEECAKKKLQKNIKYDFDAIFKLGLKFFSEGNFIFAANYFTKAIKLNPNTPNFYYNRAVCYLEQKKYKFALSDYNKVIKLNPSDVDAYNSRGICYFREKNYKLALEDFNKAIQLNNNYCKAYLNRGNWYYEQNNYESALKDYDKCILLDPNNFEAYNNRGIYYSKQKNYELALKDYNKSIKLNPSYIKAYINRGNCYSEQEIHELALNDYNTAIQLSPNDAEVYNGLGIYYFKQGSYDISLNFYNKSIQLNPKYAVFYNNRGSCYFEQRNYELALNDYNKAIQLDISYANAYFNRGVCYSEQKKYDSMLEDFNKSIKIEHSKKLCFLSSNVCISSKNYKEARYYIEKAFENATAEELQHKQVYLSGIDNAEEIDRKNQELEEKNKKLESQIEETKKANKIAHEKEKEMLSFFTHTMRNALATAPESLRQAIRLLGSEDYEKNQKHYEAINEITALFSTLSLTDCLIDTFKQSIYDTEEFKRAWQNDNTGEATPQWFIAAALRQSLNRIIFMSNTRELRKLLQDDVKLIKPTRKAFIEQVLPLDINKQGVESFYQWLNSLTAIDISIEENTVQFGVNQIKFSLLFSITSELILNALKYWSGTGKIQIRWVMEKDYYIFTVKNACRKNASSNLAGTHKGLAFIKRLMELLGEQAYFTPIAENLSFTAELKLHKNLLENHA